MAGDWIKMRPSLLTHPKVNGITRILESSQEVGSALSTGYTGSMKDVVTRNVMRSVTVTSLLIIWGAANEHTDDGSFHNADLSDIDDMVGIPGFGAAMVSVGWAEYDEESCTVTLPNFNEYNTCGKDRTAEKNAERQRRYREKKKEESNENRNVTNDVTRNDREEKRREDIKPSSAFAEFWSAYPKKVAKGDAEKAWAKIKPDAALLDKILKAVAAAVRSQEWKKDNGQFIPNPATWLNGKRWDDGGVVLAAVGGTDSRFKGAK